MLTEKFFSAALKAMNFTERGNFFEKVFADSVTMKVDFARKKLFYPAQIKNHDRNNFFDEAHRENLVVFECVNRLLDKGYKPEDIWLEKNWSLGHTQKSGRADICVSDNDKTLFIIECKTAGAEFNRELNNMRSDGGQLFSYWQQEQSCQWLMLYASDFDGDLKFSAASVSCNENIYRDAKTVEDKFKIWAEHCEKKFSGDVIFHDETIAYKIGVKPLRKRDLKNFSENKSVVNKFEEILRHNQVSNKETAFNRLISLFICKLVDETLTPDDGEVQFQFKDGVDTNETFQDRLQGLYAEGMEKFMRDPITYVSIREFDDLLFQFGKQRREELGNIVRDKFRRQKFFTNNEFAFIDVHNEKLFYLNAKILIEVVNILKDYKIIGSEDLQTLGDLFEQLLDKGFRQDAGQFFTPTPIAQFIWDSLPLEKIISDEPPKIIDYSCGAGHFLTEGFRAINDFYARKNLQPPIMWERDKLFGVEKDPRLATVSKISLFMHGANEGKIKFGDGLENYPDENILPANFDILVANPPYSVKGFKAHLKLENEFEVLDKISNDGSEIETLFVERISQLVKPKGFAAVILPSSILNKDGRSFIAARESLLKNFYIRAIVQLGGKTFGATSVSTIIIFLQKIFDPPERAQLFKDSAEIILRGQIISGDIEEEILNGYLKRTGKTIAALNETDREKIICYALTYKQTTLIISAPDKNDEQEKFLGYSWSNAKGREGIVHKKRGGFLFDNYNRAASDTLAAVIRAAFNGEQIQIPALEKFYRYATLADLLDFDADDFTKKITISELSKEKLTSERFFPTEKLDNIVEINSETLDPTKTPEKIFHYVDIGSIDSATNKIDFTTVITGAAAPSRARRLANDGDVLISTVRPYLKSFALIENAPQDTLYSTGFAVLSTKNPSVITNEFIFQLFMNDSLLMEQIKTKMSKSSYPSINQSDLKGFHILLPPVDVQSKIVGEFNSIDAQIAAAEENIQNLDADIKNKFAELFVGKNFPRVKLGELAETITKGTTPTTLGFNFVEHGINFIKVENITDTGEIIKSSFAQITSECHEKLNRSKLNEGDVVFSIAGSLGRVAIISSDILPANTNQALAIIRLKPSKNISKVYLTNMLRSDFVKIQYEQMKKGIAQFNLNLQNISDLELPLPPLEMQEKFAEYVENCEADKKSARTRLEEMKLERAELVRKYFR